jgi:hypothetical protein
MRTSRSGSLLILVALTIALYAPFLGGNWLTDDFVHLEHLERASFAGVFASPDAFGFYRPIPQASLLLDLTISGDAPWAFRLTNLLLHVVVVWTAYLLSTMLLGHGRGACLATLAFVLTPKAHPVAVLWPSARAELMMALFSFLAVLSWIRWDRGEGRGWLLAACTAYPLALMSKETAVLLPLLLLVTPTGSQMLTVRRLSGAGVMALTAVGVLIVRIQVGALTFAVADAHYNLTTPVSRWVRNASNYLERTIPSPLALLLFVGISSLLVPARGAARGPARATIGPLVVFAAAWFLVFIAPVLPIAGRSELYLYLPGFGICVLVGAVLAELSRHMGARGVTAAAAVYVAAAGGYQVSRAVSVYRDAQFSSKLVEAIGRHDALRQYTGVVVVVPQDPRTEELLRGSIGGYLGVVLRRTLGRSEIDGTVAYPYNRPAVDGLRLTCGYKDGRIVLERASGL